MNGFDDIHSGKTARELSRFIIIALFTILGFLVFFHCIGQWDSEQKQRIYFDEKYNESMSNYTTLQNQAIELGYAHFNPTNAQWEWKINK